MEYPAIGIRQYLRSVVHRLKVRGVWHYLEPPVRGWLDLACRLEGIKFRSVKVLSVLFRILRRIKPLLDFPGLVAGIGARYAWHVSRLAASWGNRDAEHWKNDKAFQLYCGLTMLQLSKLFPSMLCSELDVLKGLLEPRGVRKALSMFWRLF